MVTILRSYKFVNFFSSYHLKSFQSASILQSKSRLHSSDVQISGMNAVMKNVFVDKRNETESIILQIIRHKYFTKYYASYKDLTELMEIVYNYSIFRRNQFVLDDNDVLMLIRCCGNMMKHEMPGVRLKVLDSICQILKSKDFQFNVNHYNCLIEVYLENEKDFSPTEILSEMLNNNIQPNTLTYENLLNYYCRKGQMSDANKILQYFKEKQIPVTEKIFSALIIGNAEANDMNGAINILNTMEVMGCMPSEKAYSALLYSYAKKGYIENITETLQACERKNIVIDDNHKLEIIFYLAINGHTQHIDKILPTVTSNSYSQRSNVVKKLIYHKQIDVAFQLVSLVKSNTDKVAHNTLIYQFLKNLIISQLPLEEIIKYVDLFEDMNLSGYEKAISNCFDKDTQHYCIPLFRAWRKRNGSIKQHYFWPLLVSHGLRKQTNILEIIKIMKNEFNIEPDEETLSEFIIPQFKVFTIQDLFKALIIDIKLSPFNVTNSIVNSYVSENKLDAVAKWVELCKMYNVKFNPEKMSPLVQSLQIDNNRYKLDNNNTVNLKKVVDVPILHHIHSEYKLRKYCWKNDISNAKQILTKLQYFNGYKLSLDKMLSYFCLLVKKGMITDAFESLKGFIKKKELINLNGKQLREQFLNSSNLLAENGSINDLNELFNILKSLRVRINRDMTRSLVTVHLLQNNLEAAVESIKRISDEYGWIVEQDKVMEACINAQDVNCLQQLTDFCHNRSGYTNAILYLSLAFLKNNRIWQSKQVLTSADSPIEDKDIRFNMHKILDNNNFSLVKDFIETTRNIGNINRSILYEVLFEKYSTLNDWKEGLALWNQMIEENISPTLLHSLILSELLIKNNQQVPDSITKLAQQNNVYTQIVKAFVESNASPNSDYKMLLLEKMIKAEDTFAIRLIDQYFNMLTKEAENNVNIFEFCENDSQVNNYLKYVDGVIKEGNTNNMQVISNHFNNRSLKFLVDHPENFQFFESLAKQMFSSNKSLYKPMLIVISFHCYKNPKNALSICKELMTNGAPLFYSYKFIIESLLYANCQDQLTQVAQSFRNSNRFNKQYFYEAFLQAFDDQGKYDKSLQILLRLESNEELNDMEFRKLQATA